MSGPRARLSFTEGQVRLLLRSSELCGACYSKTPSDYGKVVRGLTSLDDLVIIVPPKDGVVEVAVAGTRNIRQWLNNIKASVVFNADGTMSHAGFRKAAGVLYPAVKEALEDFGCGRPGGPVLDFHGHSRGAAEMGELIRLLGPFFMFRNAVTLGGPRHGNGAHSMLCDSYVRGHNIRLTHNNDPVPWVPSYLRGFRHRGHHWHLDRKALEHPGGVGVVFGLVDGVVGRTQALARLRLFDGVDDHRIPTGYGPAIEALARAHGIQGPAAAPVDDGEDA